MPDPAISSIVRAAKQGTTEELEMTEEQRSDSGAIMRLARRPAGWLQPLPEPHIQNSSITEPHG